MVDNHFHASIILNIHREAVFLRRTLLSLNEAVRFARTRGLKLELVVVFDRTDRDTRQIVSSFDLSTYDGLQFVDVDNGSLGLSRNAGVEQARGEYVFTADADDLVSDNYFHGIYATAQRLGPEALYFPQYVFIFGEVTLICHHSGLDHVSPMTFVDKHPYISRVCAHRDALRRIPYKDVRLSRGYAYEDWHFNAEAVGAGMNVHAVEDTILFYRQRPGSLCQMANAVSIRQIPPSRLFEPLNYLKISGPFYKRLFVETPESKEVATVQPNPLDLEEFQAKIQSANAIDPAISLEKYRGVPMITNHMGIPPVGAAYYTLCDIVRDRAFSDIFIVPIFSRGRREKYYMSLMEAMYRLDPCKEFLVLLGENLKGVQWLDVLPPNVTVMNMALHCPSLSMDQRCLLALKIIETSRSDTRLHLCQSAFADRLLSLYGIVLQERECIYYRFADVERVESGHTMTTYSQIELIAENLDHLSKIVCDSRTAIRKDLHRLGVQTHKWKFLHAPVELPTVLPMRAPGAESRILWASRIDVGKRPSLLPLIASKLRSLNHDVGIDMFGSPVCSSFDRSCLDGVPSLHYHGSYDGFDALPLSRFSIFLYTSLHDGIPNAILEAMSYGLAVVAPDVGGISEVVIDGETGILLQSLPDDDEMAASYARALLALMSDPDLSVRLGQQARAFVREHHSPQAHAERVAELLNIQERHLQYA